jgi:hypothetical protein
MADQTPLPGRRYSEKEVAQIIKRAAELQPDEIASASGSGLSLVELEQVAREAGLDPALIRRAAGDLDERVSDGPPSRFIGAPTRLCLERTLDGEIPAEEYEVLVREIQRVLGEIGNASMLGRSMQWTSASTSGRRRPGTRAVQVIVTPRNGRTTIRIEEPMTHIASAMFIGVIGGTSGMMLLPVAALASAAIGASGGLLAAALGAAGTGVGLLGGAYLLARTIFGRVVAGRSRTLQSLMERLADHVAATAVPAPALVPAPEPSGSEPER